MRPILSPTSARELERSGSRASIDRCGSSTIASRPRRTSTGSRRQSLVEQLPRPDDASEARSSARSQAIKDFGVGSGSVRTIAGTMAIHMELERRLAAFKKTEAVVVFQSGFAANAGTVSALLTKDDVIISDELNHASIIDGCRLSRAAIKVFPHKDVGRGAQDPAGSAGRRSASCSSPTASSAWTATSAPLPELCDARRGIRLHHDGGRRACERRVRRERPRHDRSLRRARPRGHPGRHALEGHGRARRLRRGIEDADRVPLPPRAAVPVLDVASAVGRRHLPRGARRARAGAADHRAALGQHALLQGRARRRSGSTPGSARARSRR